MAGSQHRTMGFHRFPSFFLLFSSALPPPRCLPLRCPTTTFRMNSTFTAATPTHTHVYHNCVACPSSDVSAHVRFPPIAHPPSAHIHTSVPSSPLPQNSVCPFSTPPLTSQEEARTPRSTTVAIGNTHASRCKTVSVTPPPPSLACYNMPPGKLVFSNDDPPPTKCHVWCIRTGSSPCASLPLSGANNGAQPVETDLPSVVSFPRRCAATLPEPRRRSTVCASPPTHCPGGSDTVQTLVTLF